MQFTFDCGVRAASSARRRSHCGPRRLGAFCPFRSFIARSGGWLRSGDRHFHSYATKLALACPVTTTQGATDLIGALQGAIDTAETLLGCRLVVDCVDPATGETTPLVVVTDNGPAMKSVAVARWFAARSHLAHVRTRHRAPWTNGVVERWFETLKYEHHYRHDIANGIDLADHVAAFTDTYNTTRPHQTLNQKPPLDAYLGARTPQPNPPKTE